MKFSVETFDQLEKDLISANLNYSDIYNKKDQSVNTSDTSLYSNSLYNPIEQFTFEKLPANTLDSIEDEEVVENYLESIALQNSGIVVIRNHKTLLRQDHDSMKDRVKILTGGCAKLEPLYSGFIGPGMLTAAVFGELTSSPPYFSILAALRILSNDHTQGILVIVMNNLANRLNFGLACQQASHEGIKTLCLTVGEDCSGVSVNKSVGREGLCGIVFLQKIAGAMSEDKKSLYEMFCILTALKGGCLGTVNVTIEQNMLSIGSGLKGEPGMLISEIKSIRQIIKEALFFIFDPASYFSLHITKGDNIAVILNNLGKLSDFHMSLMVKDVLGQIDALGVNVVRLYSARYLSTNATGFSISVLKVSDNVLKWLDYPVNVMSWPTKISEAAGVKQPFKSRCLLYVYKPAKPLSIDSKIEILDERNLGPRFTVQQAIQVVSVLNYITRDIIKMEEYLNKLDEDHDYGTTMKKFMFSIKNLIELKTLIILTPFGLLNNLAELAATTMGGVSGAVFSVMLCSAAMAFITSSLYSEVSWSIWMDAARMARDALCTYTRVKPGDRTIFDALHPFVETFTTASVECLSKAVKAAMEGAENTATMISKSGLHKFRYPDPGACSLAVALKLVLSETQIELREITRAESI